MIGGIGFAGVSEAEAYRIASAPLPGAAINGLARALKLRFNVIRTNGRKDQAMAHGTHHPLASIIGSIALGAVAMYAFDPDKGRRRRALARDKAYSLILDTRHAAGATRRDVAHRLDGLQARARRLWTTQPTADDLQLIERVRARMGRMVAHPHALQVGALRGRVTLSGPVLAHEKASLVAAVRTVWGVNGVEDLLVVHEHPESIPSLQGGSDPFAVHPHEHWPPALRAGALSAGVLIALVGVRQRSLSGVAMAAAGIALALRGASNQSLTSLLERPTRCGATLRDGSTVDAASPDEKGNTRGDAAHVTAGDASPGRALH